ncbi:MAG: regulatory iron-sulfur-containing complex subunit RicT [Eubacteriales bacterium]|nr:regulatory iron-sulfur-containing complex subunit RicT [Eubacteriales bacterium]
MAQIIGVRFKKVGKVYYFDPCGIQTAVGQNVIVETARGVEYGEVALANRDVAEGEVVKPLKKLIRVATPSDAKVVETNQKRANEAFHICEQKIAEHGLDMKLVSVEYTFDLNKVLFYFTADGRVDFRELVKDLASVFRTRIELRQIGVRDEAKVLGGLGICGRPLCCASFLDDFQPVSINMAKQQNLSLNPTKISGTCGRLMCCLKYEQEAYEELSRVTPRVDSTVQTPDGVGVVLDTSMLRGTCSVLLESDSDTPRTYRCADCQVLQTGRKQNRSARPAAAKSAVSAAKLDSVLEQVEHMTPEAPKSEKTQAEQKKPAASKPAKQSEETPAQPEQAAEKQSHEPRRTNRPRRRKNGNAGSGKQQERTENHSRQPRGDRRQNAARNSEHTERPQQDAKHDFVDANRAEKPERQERSDRPRRRRPRRKPHGSEQKTENKE